MKKKLWLGFLVLLLLWAVGRTSQKAWDSRMHLAYPPYLQMLGSDQVSIKWYNTQAKAATLQYGQADTVLGSIHSPKGTAHLVTLKDLKANSDYWYQLEGVRYPFTTAPPAGSTKPLAFWVLGDPGQASKKLTRNKQVAQHWLQQHRPERPRFDAILTTGDNAYRSGKNREFKKQMFDAYGELLASSAVWPAYGNHDARRWAFFELFMLPEQGELGGNASGSEHYYAFDYGNVHFVFLDSQTKWLHWFGSMARWLEKDLQTNRLPWTVVVFHHPPYSKGSHDSDDASDSGGRMHYIRERIVPILEAHDVDLVLSGHSHSYERSHLMRCHYQNSHTFSPSMVVDSKPPYEKHNTRTPFAGTLYAVLGSSAKRSKGVALDHPAMPVATKASSSLILRVQDNRLSGTVLSQHGEQKDFFEVIKSAHTPQTRGFCKTTSG